MANAPRLPVGVPPGLVQNMAAQAMGGPSGPGPMPPPGPPPGPPQNPAEEIPPGSAPAPGEGAGKDKDGLSDEQVNAIKELLGRDDKAKEQVQEIIKLLGGRTAGRKKVWIEPGRLDTMARSWNSRKREVSRAVAQQRGVSPGVSEANDEALLVIWFTTPMDPNAEDDNLPLPLDDVPEYADAVRLSLIEKGETDPDKIEDQVMRECFPLREELIRNGRPNWQDQVDFVDDMIRLSNRWVRKYGELPVPEPRVLAATAAGGGNPESQKRDEESEALPAGARG